MLSSPTLFERGRTPKEKKGQLPRCHHGPEVTSGSLHLPRRRVLGFSPSRGFRSDLKHKDLPVLVLPVESIVVGVEVAYLW